MQFRAHTPAMGPILIDWLTVGIMKSIKYEDLFRKVKNTRDVRNIPIDNFVDTQVLAAK